MRGVPVRGQHRSASFQKPVFSNANRYRPLISVAVNIRRRHERELLDLLRRSGALVRNFYIFKTDLIIFMGKKLTFCDLWSMNLQNSDPCCKILNLIQVKRAQREASNFERQIHLASFSIPEYLERIENLKQSLRLRIPEKGFDYYIFQLG